MSTLKHPVGPQSSKVYWRRRLLVGLGLLAVIVVIILIIVRPSSSSGETADPGAKPAAVTTGSASPTPQPTTDPTSIPTTATEVDGAACKPDNVVVTAVTDKTNYAATEQPQMSLSIENTGTKSCVLNAGTSKQVFTITSGSETYWTSTDCQKDAVDAQVTLKPGTPITSAAPIAWDRTRSSKDTCDADRAAVPAGGASYHLTVSVDGMKSETTQFSLS